MNEITIPKGEIKDKPIILDGNTNTTITAKPMSKATIIEINKATLGETKKQVTIKAEEGSEITYINVQKANTNHTSNKEGIAYKDATINWYNCNLGGNVTETIHTILKQGATCNENGFFLGNKEQKFNLDSKITHEEQHSESNIIIHGALSNKAQCIQNGVVKVQSNAGESLSDQHTRIMLLNDSARAKSNPNQEVENNNVKMSHASAIGQIDEEKVFYMMSRGLTEKQAKIKIIEGIYQPFLESIKDEQVEKTIEQEIDQKVEEIWT